MTSLYPFHIHISFPYSHILPYPYISHIPVFIFLSISLVALPLVFSFLIFMVWKRGVFFLWFFGVGVVDGFRIVLHPVSRFALRFVSSLVPPFCSFFRFALRPAFRSASSFRFSVLACRMVDFVGRAVFVSSLWRAVVCFLSCLCVVALAYLVSYR